MKNGIFEIKFDKEKGLLTKLSLVGDPNEANFIKSGRGFCEPHGILHGQFIDGAFVTVPVGYESVSFEEHETEATAVFTCFGVTVVEKFLLEDELLRVKITVDNTSGHPVYYKSEDLAFYTPFADSYDSSEISTKYRCHTHIADFGENSYIRTERMGESKYHIGVFFNKAEIASYSQEKVPTSNDRGYFVMNVAPFSLLAGEKKELELVVFAHEGYNDFFEKMKRFPTFVRVEAKEGYTFPVGTAREFTLTANEEIKSVKIACAGRKVPFVIDGRVVRATLKSAQVGIKKVEFEVNGRKSWAIFNAALPLETLLKRRIDFIVKKQQCLDKNSPLYGAYLVYDNEDGRQYYSYDWRDHNACRERFGMAILIAKYLQTHPNKTFEASLKKFTAFLVREALDTETGEVFDGIGKDRRFIRLYNAPWVALYFTELYNLYGKESYAKIVAKIMIRYHENGGTKFYPNGIRFIEFVRVVEKSGRKEDYKKMRALFDEHIANIVKNGVNYPPHEVNFEQTIVTPATSLLMDQYQLTEEEKYLREAEKHLEILRKFDGAQPDCRRNKIPVRYWDDFWFGKEQARTYGDTFPHYWSCLSGACYDTYGKLTGKKEWCDYGRQTLENCYCLFSEQGEGHCAYVMPARVNGQKGQFYDPFANDQDFSLYFASKLGDEV